MKHAFAGFALLAGTGLALAGCASPAQMNQNAALNWSWGPWGPAPGW